MSSLALVGRGLWLRGGFVDACGVATRLLLLFDGNVSPLSALAFAVGRGLSVLIGWRGGLWARRVRCSTMIDAARRVAGARPEVPS